MEAPETEAPKDDQKPMTYEELFKAYTELKAKYEELLKKYEALTAPPAKPEYAEGELIPTNLDGVYEIKQYITKKYSFSETDSRYYILLHNESAGEVTITSNVLAYDKDNQLLGASTNASWKVTENGYDFYLEGTFDDVAVEEIDRLEYTLKSATPSIYATAASKMQVTYSEAKNKIFVTVKNTSEKAIESPAVNMFFLKDGKVVGTSEKSVYDAEYKLSAGGSVTVEFSAALEYDDILIITSGYNYSW